MSHHELKCHHTIQGISFEFLPIIATKKLCHRLVESHNVKGLFISDTDKAKMLIKGVRQRRQCPWEDHFGVLGRIILGSHEFPLVRTPQPTNTWIKNDFKILSKGKVQGMLKCQLLQEFQRFASFNLGMMCFAAV